MLFIKAAQKELKIFRGSTEKELQYYIYIIYSNFLEQLHLKLYF